MFKTLFKLFRPGGARRNGWLSSRNVAHHEQLESLVSTGVQNLNNRIELLRDSTTGNYWIKHLVDKGEHYWSEYQPISAAQAKALKQRPDLFREYVLHAWVDA